MAARARRRHWRAGLLLAAACLVSGCGTLGYYYQSAAGQLDLVCRSRDIDRVLEDETVAPAVREKLKQVTAMRAFASEVLYLPDNDSYRRYADLEREYVVWNVFAAPPLSTQPRQWCFPVVGCVVYRGYFKEQDAGRYAATLEEQGLETFVMGVPAYSTLGWFDDPVLNTVLDYPDAELAGLIFHELAHQIVYVKDDSVFNESFATAVEIEGVERWLRQRGREPDMRAYRVRLERNERVVKTILAYRKKLDEVYRSGRDRQWKLERKARIIDELKARYARMIRDWDGYEGYGRWFRQDLNNAHFAVIAAYHDKVPAFRALLARRGGDLQAFYDAVRTISRKPPDKRDALLGGSEDTASAASN